MPSNPDKLKLVKELSRPGAVFALARVPESTRFLFGGSDFKMYAVDLTEAKPEPIAFGSHASYVTGIAVAGTVAISGGYDGRLMWWDIESGSEVRTVEAHPKWIRAVAATPDGKLALSVADDMVCRLWEVESGKLVRELRGHQQQTPNHFPSMLYALAISPDGQFAATGDKVGHVVVWELATGKQAATFETPVMYTWDPVQRRHSIGGIRSLAFSPDGRLLAVGGIGKISNIDHLDGKARVEIFDWRKAERTHEFAGDKFNGLVEKLAFPADGAWLLAAGGANDGFLMFLDLKDKKYLRQEKVAMHLNALILDDADDMLYAAGQGKIAVWEMKG